MEGTEYKVAEYLLEIEAVKISPNKPFTWASGWQSPIYCDNRVSLSFPKIRTFIKEELANLVKEKFTGVEGIAGVATAVRKIYWSRRNSWCSNCRYSAGCLNSRLFDFAHVICTLKTQRAW